MGRGIKTLAVEGERLKTHFRISAYSVERTSIARPMGIMPLS